MIIKRVMTSTEDQVRDEQGVFRRGRESVAQLLLLGPLITFTLHYISGPVEEE